MHLARAPLCPRRGHTGHRPAPATAGWGLPPLPSPLSIACHIRGSGAHGGGHPGYLHRGEPGQSQAARALPFHSMNSSQNTAPGAQRTRPGDPCSTAGGTSAIFLPLSFWKALLLQVKCFQAELIFSRLLHARCRKGCQSNPGRGRAIFNRGYAAIYSVVQCGVFSGRILAPGLKQQDTKSKSAGVSGAARTPAAFPYVGRHQHLSSP